jgi:DNA cross-link repair 1A protein
VNVGSARSREKMKAWIEKWEVEKRKNGLYKVETDGWGSGDGGLRYGV